MPKPNLSLRNNPDFYEVLNLSGAAINYMESASHRAGSAISHCAGAAINYMESVSHCAGAAINFFRGPDEVTKAKNIIAKYFEDNRLDIRKIDGKSDSFLFILVRLIKENLFTEEKFKLLEEMDESKEEAKPEEKNQSAEEDQFEEDQFEEEAQPKEDIIKIFNQTLYFLRASNLLNEKSFNMAYKKIMELPSREQIILLQVMCNLANKELLNDLTITYFSVCTVDQFRHFVVISQRWLQDDVGATDKLLHIDPQKIEVIHSYLENKYSNKEVLFSCEGNVKRLNQLLDKYVNEEPFKMIFSMGQGENAESNTRLLRK